MSFACPGITHCSNCHRPLGENEYGLCKNCKEKQKKEELEIEEKFTAENIRKDLTQLRIVIQNLVNKYDAPIELYYDDKKQVHVSLHLRFLKGG